MKPSKIRWVAVSAVILVAGCATQKELVPTGGSRADGVVYLWGYAGAQPFGGQNSKCEAVNGYGDCVRFLVTMTYQCTGTPPASR